jgi:hypothetical protein
MMPDRPSSAFPKGMGVLLSERFLKYLVVGEYVFIRTVN